MENKGNPTQLWRVLQDLGCSKKCKTKETSIGINIDNSICFDKVKVATHFNSFFSDIAGNLVDKLPLIIGKYGYDFVKKFYHDKVSMLVRNFSFTPVSKEHVHKMLIGLNSHKATGLDGMPARFIIDSADIICKPLCHIVNLSIQSGEFPCDIKKAEITPIYKKKAKTEAGNYRPVSVLSIISKIIAKLPVNSRLNTWIPIDCYMNCSLASAHHFQLTLVLFTYQILLGNSKTRGITLVWSYSIYRKLLTQ